MANAKYTRIAVAEALKALGKKLDGVTVQVATPAKKTDEDGKVRTVMQTKAEPLAARHVVSAKKWANGQVTITTMDGKRYPKDADTLVEQDPEEAAA